MAELSLAYRNSMVVVKPFSDEDEENEGPERILTAEELIERLRYRPDIFLVDKNNRLRKTEFIALLIASLAGMWLTSITSVKTQTDFYDSKCDIGDRDVTIEPFSVDRKTAKVSPPGVPKNVTTDNNRKVLRTSHRAIVDRMARSGGTGVGSIRSRIAKEGIIGILTGYVHGREVVGGEFIGKGGFASGIDVILSGMKNGLKSGGSGPMVRRNAQCIGYSPGYGPSGIYGAPAGGIDEEINKLMTSRESEARLTLKASPISGSRTLVKVTEEAGKISGDGRSRSQILRVVMQNIGALRYAYNRYLREKPGIKGKITVKFAIDEFGNVVNCEVVSSSINYEELESTVKEKIMRWKFDRIDKPGDITEVVYPFVFST